MTPAVLRAERESDRPAIFGVHRNAFESDAEARLVDALREEGSIVLSLVAEVNGDVIGSVIYSRLLIDGGNCGASALAPVAVKPAWQRKGIGGLLIREAHKRLAQAGECIVLVLGDPEYYARFGFSARAAGGLRTPYDGPHLMALDLSPDDADAKGVVTYPPAFAKLG